MQQSPFMLSSWGSLALLAHPTSDPTILSSQSHLGRLGRPPHTHVVDVMSLFTLDSQSPSYVLSSGAGPVIGVFGRRKRDRVVYCIVGRHSPTFYRSWTNRSLPNFRVPQVEIFDQFLFLFVYDSFPRSINHRLDYICSASNKP